MDVKFVLNFNFICISKASKDIYYAELLMFQVLMEVMSRAEGDRFNFSRIKHIYDIWMRRIGSRRKCLIQVFR